MAVSRRDFIKTGVGSACTLAAGATGLPAQTTQPASAQAAAAQPGVPADRMPEIPADKMTPEQKKAADDFLRSASSPIFGPFVPLLRSPEVMLRAKVHGRLSAIQERVTGGAE